MEIIKVSSTSVPNHVAGAIASLMREQDKLMIQTIGAAALNQAIKSIAIAFTSYGWTQTMGDAVARRKIYVNIKRLGQFIDISAFKTRIEELAGKGVFPEVNEFWDCWLKLK